MAKRGVPTTIEKIYLDEEKYAYGTPLMGASTYFECAIKRLAVSCFTCCPCLLLVQMCLALPVYVPSYCTKFDIVSLSTKIAAVLSQLNSWRRIEIAGALELLLRKA